MLVPSPSGMADSRPIVLVTGDDPAIAASLTPILRVGIRNIEVEVHRSYEDAAEQLSRGPYHAILSNVSLGQRDDCFLLKQTLELRPWVPFIVVAAPHERAAADRILRHGAADLVTAPLDPMQVVGIMKRALWEHRLRKLLADKELALTLYRKHIAAYPTDAKTEESFKETLAHVKEAFASFDDSINLSDQGLECFAIVASSAEQARRRQAMMRLCTLHETGNEES